MSKQHTTLSKGRNFTTNSFDIIAVFGNKVAADVADVVGALSCKTGPEHAGQTFVFGLLNVTVCNRLTADFPVSWLTEATFARHVKAYLFLL